MRRSNPSQDMPGSNGSNARCCSCAYTSWRVTISLFTELEATAAYMGIAQVARAALREQHKREYDPNEVAQVPLDLPEAALLNGGYSVMRDDEPVYVPREEMTRADMEYVCAKFDALSEHFARHSRALRADWERRNAAAA